MNKKLIILEIPTILISFEVYIPQTVKIKEIIPLIARAVNVMTEGEYISKGDEILSLKETSIVLNEEATFGQYRIRNGQHLIFV